MRKVKRFFVLKMTYEYMKYTNNNKSKHCAKKIKREFTFLRQAEKGSGIFFSSTFFKQFC